MFGPPFSLKKAQNASGVDILKPEHGIIPRAGIEALKRLCELNAQGCKAVLHGSMVEMSIFSLASQTVSDLLNDGKDCFIDKNHHLQGALMVPIRTSDDLMSFVAAVEARLTRGTQMNDTSSRSHIVSPRLR